MLGARDAELGAGETRRLEESGLGWLDFRVTYSNGPCAYRVYTLAPKYLYRDYFIRPKYILFGRMDL